MDDFGINFLYGAATSLHNVMIDLVHSSGKIVQSNFVLSKD